MEKSLPFVRRRQVFHIAGYDPVTPEHYYQRFIKQAEIFKRTWGVQVTISAVDNSAETSAWTVNTSGQNWRVQTDYELWSWDDIVNANAQRSDFARLPNAAGVYVDLLISGTLLKYLKANLRYFSFAIVPPLEIALFGVIAGLFLWLAARALRLEELASSVTIVVVALMVFSFLLRWPGRRWRVQQALDDWIFSRDYIAGRRSDMECRLEQFAKVLVECARKNEVDEIIVVGHSLGALFAVEIAARALSRDCKLGRHGAPVGIVTLGATIPKCTLHPNATQIRRRIRQVVEEPKLNWVEFQSRRDAISFYKVDPASLRKVSGDRLSGKPIIRHVRVQSLLSPETFARYRLRILRLHYQSVMANERRASYDYFMMCCCPVPLASWTVASGGLLDYFEAEGSVADPGAK
jgi:hypothetical protein